MELQLNELLQERITLISEQRRVLDKAESEKRDLTAEEQQTYSRQNEALDSLEARIGRQKDVRERSRSIAIATSDFDPREVRSEVSTENLEYRAAFDSYLRYGLDSLKAEHRNLLKQGFSEERAGLVKGTNSAGGYTVPQDFYGQLVNKLEEQSSVRRAATVITTAGGNDLPVPIVSAHAAASWSTEQGTLSTADDTFGTVTLKAYKATKTVLVSTELLEDTGVNLEAYLANEIGRAIGYAEGAAYATGASGSTTTPRGLVTGATVGVTTAASGTITGDDLIDLVFSVTPAYRANGSFLMNDAVVKVIRKLKNSVTGDYLWQPGMKQGNPDTLLGYPIYIEPSMDTVAGGNTVIAFGDMKSYFIRDVGGFQIIRANERWVDVGQVGFIGAHRTDGVLVDSNGVRTLKIHA